jgi:hypothetical protein
MTSNHFLIVVREFEHSANNEGYWSYEHIVLQMEGLNLCDA